MHNLEGYEHPWRKGGGESPPRQREWNDDLPEYMLLLTCCPDPPTDARRNGALCSDVWMRGCERHRERSSHMSGAAGESLTLVCYSSLLGGHACFVYFVPCHAQAQHKPASKRACLELAQAQEKEQRCWLHLCQTCRALPRAPRISLGTHDVLDAFVNARFTI